MGEPRQRLFSYTHIVDPGSVMNDQEIREEEIVIFDLCFHTPLQCMIWLARRRLLRNSYLCSECDIQMTCSKNARQVLDGYQWICKLCKKSHSIRSDSFFTKSHLKLQQILTLIYGWAYEYPQNIIAREARLGDGCHTVIDWYNYCRDVCTTFFTVNEIAIGGLNDDGTAKTVEIDESKFFHRKYHRGRWVEGHWVFGGIERGTKKCFMVSVPDRTEATLSAVIERHILPGTIIVSDGWRAYNNIRRIGDGIYEHQVIIHEENFVDPDDDNIHTQNVENMWMRAKRKLRRQFGTSEALFNSNLYDFVWRNQYSPTKVFQEFLIAVTVQYPLA